MARNNRSKTITKMKFSELAAQWILSVSHGVKESTLAHYRYTLERYLLPVFGSDRLFDLDEQRLEQGILQVISAASGRHKPLGASSSRECLTMLRRICKYAAHLHLMRTVEVFVKLPQMEPCQTKPFSAQDRQPFGSLCWLLQRRARWAFCFKCSWACASGKCAVCSGATLI